MPDNERSPEPAEKKMARDDNEVEGHRFNMEPGGKRDAELDEQPEVEGHMFRSVAGAERKPWETQKKG
jgi:hypothetical protein